MREEVGQLKDLNEKLEYVNRGLKLEKQKIETQLGLTIASAGAVETELKLTKEKIDQLEVSLKAANDTIKRLQDKNTNNESIIEMLKLELNQAKEREAMTTNNQSCRPQLQSIPESAQDLSQSEGEEADLRCLETFANGSQSTSNYSGSPRSTRRPGTPMPDQTIGISEVLRRNEELASENRDLRESCIRKNTRLEEAFQREQQYRKIAQELEKSNYDFANTVAETINGSETRAQLADLKLVTEKTNILDAYKTIATKQALLTPFDTNHNSGYRMIANHTNRIYPTASKTGIKADPQRSMKVVLYGDFHYTSRREKANQSYHYDQSDFMSNAWTHRVYDRASNLTGQSAEDLELLLLDYKTVEYQPRTPSEGNPMPFSGQTRCPVQ